MSHLAYCILSTPINSYIGNRKGRASVRVEIESSDLPRVQVTARLMQISCRRMLTSPTDPALSPATESETSKDHQMISGNGGYEQDVSYSTSVYTLSLLILQWISTNGCCG